MLFEGSRDAIFISDPRSRFVRVNRAACELTGYGRAELLAMRIPDLHEDVDLHAYQRYHDGIMAGEDAVTEADILRKDGRKVPTEFNNRRVLIGGQPFMHTVARDLTERRCRQREMEELQEQLRQAQKMEALGTLAGGIAHDFNNLLGVVMANAELLSDPDTSAEVRCQGLTDIRAAAREGRDLVRNLLVLSRREPLQFEAIDAGATIRDLQRSLLRLLPESIDVDVEAPEDLPLLWGNRSAIQQIVLNLASNAQDAMPGGGRLRIAVDEVTLDPSSIPTPASMGGEGHSPASPAPPYDWVRITVADTGIGMPAAVRARVFEPFFTTKSPTAGTGLGLAMVHGLVAQHDGFVHLESEEGAGTTVRVHIPAVDAEAPVAHAGARPPTSAALPRGAETILIVEDEAPLRRAAERVLVRLGYRTITAEDGVEALDVLRARHGEVDLVLSDAIMPRMGGAELHRRLREEGHDVRFLLTTGYNHMDHAGVLPEVEVLPKPWLTEEMAMAIRKALE